MPGGATSGTATVISALPYSDSDTTTTSAGLWYVFTPDSAIPTVLGLLVSSAVAQFGVLIFSPDATTAYPLIDTPTQATLHNKPCQFPVDVGTPYYFNVKGPNNPAAYTISVLAAPLLDAPVGSIFVNDDHDGYPLALLSAVDGSVLHFVAPFPNGENADVLASGVHTGRILVHDRADDHLKLYSPTFDLLADLDYTSTGDPKYPIRADHTRSQFYVGKPVDPANGSVATVTTVTSAGAFGPQTWVLPTSGLYAIATNVAGTILYFTGQTTTTNSPVQRWDLINDVALSDLAPGLGATWATMCDIVVLGDDTIVVSYQSTTPATAPVIKLYTADGTTLQTWTITGQRSVDVHLATALDDPVSVWVWTKLAGVSQFDNIRASDGTVLTTFDVREFEEGIWIGTILPIASERFGHSLSCPFLILRVASPPAGLITGTIAVDFGTSGGSGELSDDTLALVGYRLPPRHDEDFCRSLAMTIAALSPDARQRVFDALGAVMPGALLYAYEASTSTPLATYSDSALTVPNANPLVSSASGLFGPIFLLPQAYRMVLRDASANLIWEQDNVQDSGELLGITVAALQTSVTTLEDASETKFCTTAFSQANSTTLNNVIGLTGFVLAASGVYKYDLNLSGTAGGAGGIKIAFKYTTAVLTNLESSAIGTTASAVACQHVTSVTDQASLFAQTAAVLNVRITGRITVNAAGTLAIQAAQNVSDGTATTIAVGSWATFTKVS